MPDSVQAAEEFVKQLERRVQRMRDREQSGSMYDAVVEVLKAAKATVVALRDMDE